MPMLKMVQPLVANSVDRLRKGDRVAPAHQANNDESKNSKIAVIAVVEVVGIRDAAIVYRDRSGRELFRTDPVANVTIVTKGLLLPQVTIRESKQSEVEQVPVAAQRPEVSPELTEGCETVVSPFMAPSLSHLVGRCLALAKTDSKYAAALR
ncbi:hypothetical protein [Candidatus Binatus sp.]|uniref:hypothetical protein n=1 Tax=Candidatus Binatus sp. TaxID=2811406 RepID=UPI00272C7ABF|nr:hypothetical protein [Candidatus Binatus sp.]